MPRHSQKQRNNIKKLVYRRMMRHYIHSIDESKRPTKAVLFANLIKYFNDRGYEANLALIESTKTQILQKLANTDLDEDDKKLVRLMTTEPEAPVMPPPKKRNFFEFATQRPGVIQRLSHCDDYCCKGPSTNGPSTSSSA